MKELKVIIPSAIAFTLLIIVIFISSKAANSQKRLAQNNDLVENLKQQIELLSLEKGKAVKEKERLEADSTSYLGLTTKLQTTQENLQSKLTEKEALIRKKNSEIKALNDKLRQYETKERLGLTGPVQKGNALKEKESLENEIKNLKQKILQERALYQYNLGVAYTEAEFYAQAIEAYEKSLEANPDNPEAHYNLGLLYQDYEENSEKAALHYEKYLELKPQAEDSNEVKALIKELTY
ncbi:MAG: tetratricopeptide repeat protein [Candidatus Omnitrophica bacterium]|nr:tetratricopeptide repeat protein [Candidatus Omnitrophota bacterium]